MIKFFDGKTCAKLKTYIDLKDIQKNIDLVEINKLNEKAKKNILKQEEEKKNKQASMNIDNNNNIKNNKKNQKQRKK